QVAVAGRRSNIDFVFDKLVPKDTFNVVAAPLYWDYQAVVEHKFNHGRFRVAALGASDQLRFVFSEPNKESPALRGNVSAKLEFHRLQLLHEMQLGKSHGANILQRAQVTLGLQFLDQQVGPAIATLRTQDLESRLEWELPTTDFMTLLAGFDFVGQRAHGSYRGFAAQSNEGAQPLSFSAQDLILVDTTTFYLINPAAYIEARVLPTASWTLLPGIRVDYAHQLDAVTVDPRFAQRWEVVPDTTLKSAVGFYSQAPQYYESLKGVGNPNVNPYHALHASVGVEQHVTDGFDVSSEAFYKYLYDRVVGTEAGAPPFFVNQGQGRIFGIETGASLALGDLRARGAYTLSRSERQDRADPWRLFDQDQTHVLSLAANYRLGAGWELGSRYRYITGNPTTPIDGAVYDATRGVYLPHIGRLNTARDPAFSELDVRIEKQFAIGTGKLAAYLDVQNVTFRDNKQGYTYSYDYSVRQGASTTPFFPNLGLRGEL
ncbi:MAG TPA: TonB-dependent receptor, partial [Polyangiaceae bacterium]|nr:TonB-dependent receptor [Polyangiaceae bacterium]